MKSFFKTLFASTIGVVIGLSIFGFLAFAVFISVAMSSGGSSEYKLKDKTILNIDLNGSISDRAVDNPFGSLLGKSEGITLDNILDAITKAKENEEIKGIYIKAGDVSIGLADLEPIRKALLDFKTSGKFIVSYGDGYSQGAYYLASVANKVVLNPKGTLDFHGLGANLMFVKGLYEKLGVKFQVFKVGTFKSAVEPLIQEKMSDANRLQTSAYLNDIWSHLLKGISESRNISVDQLNTYADQCLTFTQADSLVEYKMVDTLMYTTQMDEYLKQLVELESDKKLNLASIKNMTSIEFKKKEEGEDQVAILYAEGNIVDDEPTGLFSSGNSITAKEYVKELNKLKENDKVKAVVFRVNSPGGSAYASEQIWNAVVELKEKKPVIVSMGTYAASGGYYISCAANTIVAEPTTLTGSIGIFGVIPDGTELANKMGVNFDEVKTNKHSNFGGRTFGIPFLVAAQSRGFNEEEQRMLQKYIESGYDLFITRCADGRSKTKEEIDAIGQGRVWTGKQALEIGLVDRLGGLNDAIALAVDAAKLDKYKVSRFPAQKDFFAKIMEESFGSMKLKTLKMYISEEEYSKQLMIQQLQNTDIQMAVMPDRVTY